MEWERFNRDFPDGAMTENFGFVNTAILNENPNIDMLIINESRTARSMVIKIIQHVYSKDNYYASRTLYDVYYDIQHPDPFVYPLNAYGSAMVQDYLYFNSLED